MVFNTFFLLFTEVRGGEPHFKDSRLPDVWIVSSYMYKFYLPLLKKSLDSELQQHFVVLCFVLCFFCVVFCAVPCQRCSWSVTCNHSGLVLFELMGSLMAIKLQVVVDFSIHHSDLNLVFMKMSFLVGSKSFRDTCAIYIQHHNSCYKRFCWDEQSVQNTYHHLLSSPGCDGRTIHRMKDRRKKIKVERPTQLPIVLGVEARKWTFTLPLYVG